MTRVSLHGLACSLSLSILACGGDGPSPNPDLGAPDLALDQGGPPVVARRAGRSASIAVDEDATTIAAANRATDDVTFFDLATRTERARVAVGDEPTAVLFSPSGDSLFVLNAADGTVTEIELASGSAPRVARTHAVGPEPMGAALSPTGRFLYVSSWTGGAIHILDTTTRVVERVVLGGAPYAVCVTNDGDDVDSDETVYVTDFYSHAGTSREGTDGSRTARVFRLDADGASLGDVTLTPLAVTGVEAAIDAANTQAFPNQLYACTIANDHVYVTAVGASPAPFAGATDFRQNVHGLVYAVSLSSHAQVAARTVNLSQLVSALATPKRFVSVPVSIEFVEGSEFAYIASMTSDAVLRLDYSTSPPRAGSPSGATFLPTGQMPTGIAIAGSEAFVYNEVSRSISRVDLASQTTPDMSIASAPQPVDSEEQAELRGQRFFTTGLGRWSSNGWVSCVSCHPGGTTDNVTWVFPTGPRQTSDTSASFDESGAVQRIFNWTAIFDEVHDFELNTRTVAGGVGAIVSNAALDASSRIDFVGAGGVGNPTNGFNVGSAAAVAATGAVPDDWDDVEAYVRTLRSLNGDPGEGGDPVAGRAVFVTANCQNCHGGALWTLSERYFRPVLNGDLRTLTLAEAGIATIGDVRADQVVSTNTSAMSVLQNDANGAPQRHTCVVRDVGTFNAGATGRGAAEVRQTGAAAQGVDGFNVPSLLNIGLGAPFLHNGAAETLEQLLDPSGEFTTHLRAGNQVFTPSAQQLADLIAFLRTIDDGTTPIDVPAGQRFCPEGVSPPVP